MNDDNIAEWKSGDLFQNDAYSNLYAKHRKYTAMSILGNPCFLIKKPLFGIVKANIYFCKGDAIELINECYRFSKEKKIPHIEIRTSIENDAFARFPCKQRGTYIIDLREDKDILFSRIQRRTRNYIQKSSKKGVRVKIVTNIEDLDRWWDIYISTAKRKNFTYENYDLARDVLLHENLSKLCLAEIDDEIASGCILHCGDNTVLQWICATDIKFSKYKASGYLYWKMIEWAKEQGFLYYDMGGALPLRYDDAGNCINNGKDKGPSEFKKKFGGDYRDIYEYQIITNKIKYRIIKALINARFKLIKHL